MTPDHIPSRIHRWTPACTVLTGGLAVGVLDILAARGMSLLRGGPGFERILQGIASGLLGSAAREGGWATAALGLALHFLIATLVVLAYHLASRRAPVLARRPWLFGPPYGALVYFMMYLVVLPLSASGGGGLLPPARLLPGLGIHLLFVGLPAALAVHAGAGRPA